MEKQQQTSIGGAPCQGCSCGGVGAGGAAEHAIDRRDFLTYGAAALAAWALAGCAMPTENSSPTSINTTLSVSQFPALNTVGGVATTSINGTPVAIVRESATTFSAFSLICPHQGATIGAFSNGFQCPRHGATFNKQGQWIGGQPTNNMQSYPTTYDQTAGTITIG